MDSSFKINQQLISKVLETVDKGLTRGKGEPIPGKMCVEAAVCYAMGLPHSDNPPCVGQAVRCFKISINDGPWPTVQDRAQGLRKLAVAQLGSDQIDQVKFSNYVTVETIKRILPLVLEKVGLTKEAEECRQVTDLAEASKAICAAGTAARTTTVTAAFPFRRAAAVAVAAAAAAAAAAAGAAAAATAGAADAVRYTGSVFSTGAIAATAAADAAIAATALADKEETLKFLNLSTQICLEALIKLESPGTKYLDLLFQ